MIRFLVIFLFLSTIFSASSWFVAFGFTIEEMMDEGKIYDVFNGLSSGEGVGLEISSLGDIDGDGTVELGISDSRNGEELSVYIISGRSWYSSQIGGLQGSEQQVLELMERSGIVYKRVYSEAEGFGYALSSLGDINGDGYTDLAISSPFVDDGSGKVSVILGSRDFFAGDNQGSVKIDELISSSGGFEISGEYRLANLGISLSAGDIDGDGNNDIIMGSYNRTSPDGVSSAGSVYVYFGSSRSRFDDVLIRDSVREGGAIEFLGQSIGERVGWSVKGLGDIDGDGNGDFVVGAPGYDTSRGKVYVVFGSQGLKGRIALNGNLLKGRVLQLFGESVTDEAGWSVGGGKDFNADGVPDIIIGARSAKGLSGLDDAGRVYVVAGRVGLSGRVSLGEVGKSLPGYKLYGEPGTSVGVSVDMLDDFNGDGLDDFIIGSLGYGRSNRIFVLFGWMEISDDENGVELLSLTERKDGVLRGINFISERDDAGISIHGVGDINNDGFSDVLIGAPLADSDGLTNSGKVYLLFGHKIVKDSNLDGERYVEGSMRADSISASVAKSLQYGYGGDDTITLGSSDFSVLHGGQGRDRVKYTGSLLHLGASQDFIFRSIEEIDLSSSSVRLKIESGVDLGLGMGEVLTVMAGKDDKVILEGFEEDGEEWSYISDDGKISLKIEGEYTESGGSVFSGVSGSGIDEVDLSLPQGGDVSIFSGTSLNMRGGYSLSSAGDFDGDGIDDVMVGSVYSSDGGRKRNGSVHIFYGRTTWKQSNFEMGSGDGLSVLRISGGSSGDRLGWSVSGEVDINGDGIDDIVIGVPYSSAGKKEGVGRVYVIFGRSYSNVKEIDLGDIEGSGFDILEIEGEQAGDHTGWSVSLSDDINGDGLGELLIGVPKGDVGGGKNSGRVLVLYGSKKLGGLKVSAGQIGRSLSGLRLEGNSSEARFGWSVSSAGDRDGDGLSEIVVGEPGVGSVGSDMLHSMLGRVYIYSGSRGRDLKESVVLRGEDLGVGTGFSVGGGKDVDGDGVSDVVLGAMRGGNGAGVAYILSSKGELTAITGSHVRSRFGYSVGMVGDANGDGIAELVIGSPSYGLGQEVGDNRGAGYLLMGRKDWLSGGIDDMTNTVRVLGSERGGQMGLSVASGGDSNADGLGDVLIGSYYSDPNGLNNGGMAYLIFGGRAR